MFGAFLRLLSVEETSYMETAQKQQLFGAFLRLRSVQETSYMETGQKQQVFGAVVRLLSVVETPYTETGKKQQLFPRSLINTTVSLSRRYKQATPVSIRQGSPFVVCPLSQGRDEKPGPLTNPLTKTQSSPAGDI